MILFIGIFLTKHGYNPTFMELLARDLMKTYHVHFVSEKKNKVVRLIDMCFHFYNNLKEIKLVIIDTYSTDAYYFALVISFLSKIHNKPYILILSGGNLEVRLKKSPSFSLILKNSNKNISPSKFLYNVFHNYNFNTLYIPNYIDLSLYPYNNRLSIKPKLIWVRSFHQIYNPKMAVLVLNKLIKSHPDAHLCMVGPVKDHSIDGVKKLVSEYNINNHITITGKLEKREWIELASNYDVFINTTNYDNHPVTLLEAMSLGLPIVSTNAGGIPDLLNHNQTAKLVNKDDVDSMVDCIIEYMVKDEERLRITSNARELIEKEFNKEIIIPKWTSLIDRILK